MSNAIRIHNFALSGHCHRVVLFANLAGIDHTLIDVDLAAGEHRKEPFLSLNPFGQVPVLEDGDTVVSDSNAILVYLARKYAPDWIPADAAGEAQVQKFLSFAAGEIANGPAAARLITVFGAPLDAERAAAVAEIALTRLEKHLEGRNWAGRGSPNHRRHCHLQLYGPRTPRAMCRLRPTPGSVPTSTASGLCPDLSPCRQRRSASPPDTGKRRFLPAADNFAPGSLTCWTKQTVTIRLRLSTKVK